MKILLSIILFTLIAISAFAQANLDKEQVQSACMDYLEGFYEGDTAKIIRSVDKEVFKYGYYKDRNSATYAGEPMSFQEMIDYANNVKAKQRFPKADTPKKVEIYEVQDQTAAAKVTAWWGTDYILLAKLNGKWMIRTVLWQGPLKTDSK
ncbi:MAG: nuclear transport factor 2 family protein [Saprospiraceae bacterium]|nr:nuclear transport factor 2 family protein [Saprospiraceae bacterium]